MKKAFIGLLILVLIAWVQAAYGATSVSGRPCPGGASCTYTAMDALSGTGYTSTLIGYSTTYYARALSWTESNAASGYTAKRISVRLKKVGSPTFSYKYYICTNNATGPKPNTCTAVSASVSAGDLTTSFADYTVDYPTGYAIADSTRYWIAIIPDAIGNGDASNHVMWESSGTGDENTSATNTTLVWGAASDTSFAGYFSVSQCE